MGCGTGFALRSPFLLDDRRFDRLTPSSRGAPRHEVVRCRCGLSRQRRMLRRARDGGCGRFRRMSSCFNKLAGTAPLNGFIGSP